MRVMKKLSQGDYVNSVKEVSPLTPMKTASEQGASNPTSTLKATLNALFQANFMHFCLHTWDLIHVPDF